MESQSKEVTYTYEIFISQLLKEDLKVTTSFFIMFCRLIDQEIPYEEISKIIFDRETISPDSDIDVITNNIEYVIREFLPAIMVSNIPSIVMIRDGAYKKMADKLKDGETLESYISKRFKKIERHFLLAIRQREYMEKNMAKINLNLEKANLEIARLNQTITDQRSKYEKTTQEYKDIKKNIYSEFVAILGIFSALIFGLFGGFESISSAINTYSDKIPFGKVIIIVDIIFISVVVLIYALIKWIGILIKENGINNNSEIKESMTERSFFIIHKQFFFFISLLFIFLFIGILMEVGRITGISLLLIGMWNGKVLFFSVLSLFIGFLLFIYLQFVRK